MKQIFCEKCATFTLIGKVSPDRMKVFVEGHPAEGSPAVSAREINDVIWKYVPQRLVHERVVEEIAEMFSRGEAVTERRVSKGEEPVPGQDGKLVLMVKAYTQKPDLAEDQRGFINLNELHLFDNITTGQIVARIYPPHPGKDGSDAFGKAIPFKPGKPFKPSFDKKTLSLSAASGYEVITALVSGYLLVESGSLRAVEDLVVSGNVDFHIGNINFVGSVTIRGDIMPGFSVQAQKGIVVTGAVHKGSLVCAGGSIECKGSVSGGEGSRIAASGSLKASVLNEVHAEISGDLEIAKEIRDSRLYVQGVVLGDKAALLGGELRTAQGAQFRQVGFEAGRPTIIHLSSTLESRHEYTQLLEQIASHEHVLHLLELHLGPLARNPARIQLLKGDHKLKIEKLHQKFLSVQKSLDTLRGKKLTISRSAEMIKGLRVNVHQIMYAGVEVNAGEHSLPLKDSVPGPASLTYDTTSGNFSWGPLVPLTLTQQDSKEIKNGQKK